MAQKRMILWVFYGGVGLLLIMIVSGVLSAVFPSGISARIAFNSEGYLFALVLAAWIQFALPRMHGQRRITWSIGVGAFWALLGIGLILSELPSRVRTLNEAALGLAIILPYVALRRPLQCWVPYSSLILVALTIWAVAWAPDSWVIDQAETFGFVVLAMLTFDVFDPQLLDRSQPAYAKWPRPTWYGFMILEPVVVSFIGTGARAGGGPVASTLEYLGRIHESFVGILLAALILHVARAYAPSIMARGGGSGRRTAAPGADVRGTAARISDI